MNLSPTAKAELYRGLARRLKAAGGNVGEVDAITHDERSLITLLGAIVDILDKQAPTTKAP